MSPIEQLCFDLVCIHHRGDQPFGASATREAFHSVEDALGALQRAEHSLENTLSERATVVSWFCPAWWRRKILARCFLRDVTLVRIDLKRALERLRRVASHTTFRCAASTCAPSGKS